MSEVNFVGREDRQRRSSPIKFVADENTDYDGMMWDESINGFSAFIKLFDHKVTQVHLVIRLVLVKLLPKKKGPLRLLIYVKKYPWYLNA